MHISGLPLDLYSFLPFLFTAFVIVFGLLHLMKNTASKYFVVEDTFDEGNEEDRRRRRQREKVSEDMLSVTSTGGGGHICASCGNSATRRCTRCKAVRYCSETCQSKHWKGGHKLQCNEFKIGNLRSIVPSSSCGSDSSSVLQLPKKVLFPYEEFVKLFTWDRSGFPPCGLLNCGNSCFANVVLQCLSCTRPLVAYLLETGHRRECRRNDWCFLCELQTHVERAKLSLHPFSPINILSRLPNIGGNLGYGKQEDAHEFMRFAIDTMQSVCLDEFGGEKALHPVSLETTLIQYIFGGQLQSQVTCTECNKISNRCESMMDLTVEIQGDAASLEDCLDQFTVKEWLDGENMYKCDGCNDYVKAWKRLTVRQAPNVLTITLKRFQSGRFGKLNKRVTFPETLDLGPYMSDGGDGTDLYRLYAVVVHVDMLNASYFGHYICYTKDFCGNWYRIDDCKVSIVELEEVLAQGAYMLLYSRTCVRPHCVKPLIPSTEERPMVNMAIEAPEFSQKPCESVAVTRSIISVVTPRGVSSDLSQHVEESNPKEDPMDVEPNDSPRENPVDVDLGDPPREDPVDMDLGDHPREDVQDIDIHTECSNAAESVSSEEPVHSNELNSSTYSKEPQPIVPHNFEIQVPVTDYDVECSFKEVNEETVDSDSELQPSKVAVNGYLTGQNDSHEVAETSSSLLVARPNPTTETLHEVNPELEQVVPIKSGNGFLATQNTETLHEVNPRLDQVVPIKSGSGFLATQNTEIKPLKSAGKNSCSRTKSKPLFSPGFLDKGTKDRSINSNGKAHLRTGEVCPLPKANGFCNGFAAKPGLLHENGSSEINNNHDGVLAYDSVLTSSFTEEQCLKKKSKSENCNGGEGFYVVENASSRVNLVQRVIPSSASCEEASSSTEAS